MKKKKNYDATHELNRIANELSQINIESATEQELTRFSSELTNIETLIKSHRRNLDAKMKLILQKNNLGNNN